MDSDETLDTWAIVELMGHRKLAGRAREETRFGKDLLRLDIPGEHDAPGSTHYFNPDSLYGFHPVSEELARAAAKRCRLEPISRWELPEEASSPAQGTLDLEEEEPEEIPL